MRFPTLKTELGSYISTRQSNGKNRVKRVFTPVNYRQFRQHLAGLPTSNVEGKGFETAIYDQSGDIQAIVHAASIDSSGHCFPAEYFIRSTALVQHWDQVA
jgi:hypothetical protein